MLTLTPSWSDKHERIDELTKGLRQDMALIDTSGRVARGFFDKPIGKIAYQQARLKSPLGEILPIEARDAAFRHFQFMGAVSDRYALGCAFSHSPIVKGAFIYLFDMETNTFLIQEGLSIRKSDTYDLCLDPDEGCSTFQTTNAIIQMRADLATGTKTLSASLEGGAKIELQFQDAQPAFMPMRICTQTGATGWTYAQKVAGVPATGFVSGEFGTLKKSAPVRTMITQQDFCALKPIGTGPVFLHVTLRVDCLASMFRMV